MVAHINAVMLQELYKNTKLILFCVKHYYRYTITKYNANILWCYDTHANLFIFVFLLFCLQCMANWYKHSFLHRDLCAIMNLNVQWYSTSRNLYTASHGNFFLCRKNCGFPELSWKCKFEPPYVDAWGINKTFSRIHRIKLLSKFIFNSILSMAKKQSLLDLYQNLIISNPMLFISNRHF